MTKKKAAEAAGDVPLSRFQKFTIVRVHRSRLKNAPYNPRVITPEAKDRLRKILERKGLLEALVWNVRTEHIVGGHRRLECLDALG